MYPLLWLISIHCVLSSAQLDISNNGQTPLQVQSSNSAKLGVKFPDQSQYLHASSVRVLPENVLVDGQQQNYLQAKSGANVEAQQYSSPVTVDFSYHDYDKMTKLLRQITARYPSLTALYSIGKSVQGKD